MIRNTRCPEYQFVWFGYTNLNTIPLKIKEAVQTKLDNLYFPGYVDREVLKGAYSSADLFWFPIDDAKLVLIYFSTNYHGNKLVPFCFTSCLVCDSACISASFGGSVACLEFLIAKKLLTRAFF